MALVSLVQQVMFNFIKFRLCAFKYCYFRFVRRIGDIEEFPALDPIPIYPVRVDSNTNEIKVRISHGKLLNGNHGVSKPLGKADDGNSEIVVVIGSGAAGHGCVETLRQEGYTGRIIIVTKEKHLPYDRTKLSKAMNLDGSKLALRTEEYYKVKFN